MDVLDGLYLSVADDGYRQTLDLGDEFALEGFRVYQPTLDGTSNRYVDPDMHYEIIAGDSVSVSEVKGGEGQRYVTVTAVKPGVSIVKVTYDESYLAAKIAAAEERARKAEAELAKMKAAKKANPVKAMAKAKTLKAKTLKKKAVSFKALTVKGAKGKVTYSKVKVDKKKFAKKFAINKSTGKITAKKVLKKGTYKVTVKVTAAGNGFYEAASRNVVVKVTVK